MSSTRASICHTTIRSVIWPMARVMEMAASSVSLPSRTRSTMVDRAAWSRSVKATSSSPRLGKPRARQSFRADSSESPAPAATSRRRSLRSPPSSRASRALAASRSADIAPAGAAGSSAGAAAGSPFVLPSLPRRWPDGPGLRRIRFEGGVRGSAGPSSGSRVMPGAARSVSWWTFSAFISSTFSRLPGQGLARVVRHAVRLRNAARRQSRRWRQA